MNMKILAVSATGRGVIGTEIRLYIYSIDRMSHQSREPSQLRSSLVPQTKIIFTVVKHEAGACSRYQFNNNHPRDRREC